MSNTSERYLCFACPSFKGIFFNSLAVPPDSNILDYRCGAAMFSCLVWRRGTFHCYASRWQFH